MTYYTLDKHQLGILFSRLVKTHEIIAPVKEDLVRFSSVTHPDQVYLDEQAYFSAKEYFFKKKEVLFTFNKSKLKVPKQASPKRVFFGLRRCDLNAIHHQDNVFLEQVHDPYYAAARKESILIGYHCWEAPSQYCFCGTLDLKDFYDLMFYSKDNQFIIEAGSEKGKKFIKTHSDLFKPTDLHITKEEKVIKGADRLQVTDISPLYDHKDWKKGVDLCLSCGACTNVCPTCYCFEHHDEVTTKNPEEGERVRTWSSCQLPEFTQVAGDHVFREDREERFKHRIYHQLDYFKEKNGINLCVGCGRCISGCPTRIDFVDIINKMKK